MSSMPGRFLLFIGAWLLYPGASYFGLLLSHSLVSGKAISGAELVFLTLSPLTQPPAAIVTWICAAVSVAAAAWLPRLRTAAKQILGLLIPTLAWVLSGIGFLSHGSGQLFGLLAFFQIAPVTALTWSSWKLSDRIANIRN